MDRREFGIDIEDYSGLNFDADVLDRIKESSHSETNDQLGIRSDDILDEEHWTTDSFDELKVDQEF